MFTGHIPVGLHNWRYMHDCPMLPDGTITHGSPVVQSCWAARHTNYSPFVNVLKVILFTNYRQKRNGDGQKQKTEQLETVAVIQVIGDVGLVWCL